MPANALQVKRGTPPKLKQLIDLVDMVMRRNAPRGYGMGDEFPHLFSRENVSNLYYIEKNGKPVSHVGFVKYRCNLNGPVISVASVGSVATLAEYRGRRYATHLLKSVLQKMERDNISLLLVSGTRSLYKRLDCVETGRVFNVTIPETALDGISRDELFKVRHIRAGRRKDEAGRILKVYMTEPYRYLRDITFMKMILDAFWFRRFDWNMQLFEIVNGNELLAYAVAYTEKNKEGKVKIWEWAGSRYALLSSLRDIMTHFGAKMIEFNFIPDDLNMLSLVESCGIKPAVRRTQGTVRPMNVSLLIEELQPWFIEHLGGEVQVKAYKTDRWTFRGAFGVKKIRGRRELAEWLFGTGTNSLGMQLMITDDLNYV